MSNDPVLDATLADCARQERALYSYGQSYECPGCRAGERTFISSAHLFVHLRDCPQYRALFSFDAVSLLDSRPAVPHSVTRNES